MDDRSILSAPWFRLEIKERLILSGPIPYTRENGSTMNPHRLAKNEQLTRLAAEVTGGVIVELGAYRGEGTVALCQGARVPVYAVDDYLTKTGWAGEKYNRADYDRFIEATRGQQRVRLIIDSIENAARNWRAGNIGLLVWDLGMMGRLVQDFGAWQDKVTGKFVIHDTDDQRLGSKGLNPAGWRKYKEGVFWILERTP